MDTQLSRRKALKIASAVSLLGLVGPETVFGSEKPRPCRIGACDWSIGKANNPESFALAREIGLDGLQISMGTAANDMQLRKPDVQRAFLGASKSTGVVIASLAIAELNNVPYKSDPRAVEWVEDSIQVCKALGVKIVLLAFFGKGDLIDDEPGITEVVKRLKAVAPKAEKAGVVFGIESWLSAKQHLEILDRVGSPAVKVYYDVCNSNDRGYDICSEITMLGNSRICEFHAKENGALLGQGKVDFRRVKSALEDIGYEGFIHIEGAIPKGKGILESYQANNRYLREVLSCG